MKRLCALFSAQPLKGKGKDKDARRPDKSKACGALDTDEGCKFGGACHFYHRSPLPSGGKCFRCGAKEHTVKDCPCPKSLVKGKGKGKSGGKGDGKPTVKALVKDDTKEQTQPSSSEGGELPFVIIRRG